MVQNHAAKFITLWISKDNHVSVQTKLQIKQISFPFVIAFYAFAKELMGPPDGS